MYIIHNLSVNNALIVYNYYCMFIGFKRMWFIPINTHRERETETETERERERESLDIPIAKKSNM